MWKWDPEADIVKFHDVKDCPSVDEAYMYMNKYRIVRIVELSDMIAANTQNIRTRIVV